MRGLLVDSVAVALVGLLLYAFGVRTPAPLVPPQPTPAPCPNCPQPRPDEKKPRPWLPWRPRGDGDPFADSQAVGKIVIGNGVAPDGKTELACDLPVDQRIKNIGSRVDGAGMCVASSIEMAARWAGLEQMRGFRDWCAKFPGGAYAGKMDKQIKAFCAEKNIPVPPYIQYEGSSTELLKTALASNRMLGVTYSGRDGVRYRGPIAHMVDCAAFTEAWVGILDNNAIAEDQILWMSPGEFIERWKGNGGGWLFCWLAPGPPPVPKN